MFSRRQIRELCLLILISVFLMGMCPNSAADSFFSSVAMSGVSYACHNSSTECTTLPLNIRHSLLRPTSSASTHVVAYTRENTVEYEICFTPISTKRQIILRHSGKACFAPICSSDLFTYLSKPSGTYSGPLLVENFSNAVIVCYIHHQDGAKS